MRHWIQMHWNQIPRIHVKAGYAPYIYDTAAPKMRWGWGQKEEAREEAGKEKEEERRSNASPAQPSRTSQWWKWAQRLCFSPLKGAISKRQLLSPVIGPSLQGVPSGTVTNATSLGISLAKPKTYILIFSWKQGWIRSRKSEWNSFASGN